MMYATKIKMKSESKTSQSLLEIDEIFISGAKVEKFYKKALIHEKVKSEPGSIKVGITPHPNLIDEVSVNGEKYVRSSPNTSTHDNLFQLPKE